MPMKGADLRNQINHIKETHGGIQSNQFQLRGISNASSFKKDKSRLNNQSTSPKKHVMPKERMGYGTILEEFN